MPLSFTRLAADGVFETTEVIRPIASSRGAAALTASSDPAATIANWPAAATSGRPNTGAETKQLPASRWELASRSASATLMVLHETCSASGARLSTTPPQSSTTFSTAWSLASMVMTASPRQASATVRAGLAPCASKASALPGVRL